MRTVKNILRQETSLIIVVFISVIAILLNYILPEPLSLEAIALLNHVNTGALQLTLFICIFSIFKFSENDPLLDGICGKLTAIKTIISYIILMFLILFLTVVATYLIELY